MPCSVFTYTISRAHACMHACTHGRARRYGVAPAAEVVAVQVLDCAGTSTEADVAMGIEWVVTHATRRTPRRPSVISLSLGGDEYSAVLDGAIQSAREVNILAIVAAGNSAKDACYSSPSGSREALTVGATGLTQPLLRDGKLIGETGDEPPLYDVRANFSNFGACVDVFAPGEEILAGIPVYAISALSHAMHADAHVCHYVWSAA